MAALAAIQAAWPSVTDFERDFPSLCFALATGVGKTRLMGAFISYLYLSGRSRNFFVLAPNTTIYDKLIADFTPNTKKYVFKGIAEFAQIPPILVTGDMWDQGRGVRGGDLFGKETAIINIFNVDKINKDGGRIKKLHEYIGQSYFDYLAELPDLVLLMDEAHRYRGKAGWRAVGELRPVIGLELTATPRSVGARSERFKNVIFDYSLGQAMADGFVKEPAVATREDFRADSVTPEQLERISQTSPTDGVGDAKLLKSLECSIKGRHYRGWRSRGFSAAPGRDFRRRLSGKLELQLSKQEQLILFRLSITGQDDHPIVRRGQFDIDHLHAGEFFEHELSASIPAPAPSAAVSA